LIIAIGFFIDSWLIMIFGFFMGFRVRSIERLYRLRNELKEKAVTYNTTYKLLSNRDFVKIKEVLLNQSKALRTYVDALSPEESDPLLANQVNSVLVTPVKRDASLLFKGVVLLVWFVSILLPFVLLVVYHESIRENYGWYFKLLSNQ
jgi:hypothetical protein